MFHPYRKKHSDGTECDKKGRCRKSHEWVDGPHYHHIGFGRYQKSNEFYDETGWIYKNKGFRKSTKATIAYLLSHVGLIYRELPDGKKRLRYQTVVWFGKFSYNKIRVKEEKIVEETEPCAVCGKDLHIYECNEFFEMNQPLKSDRRDWEDYGLYIRKRIIRIYELRRKTGPPSKQIQIGGEFCDDAEPG